MSTKHSSARSAGSNNQSSLLTQLGPFRPEAFKFLIYLRGYQADKDGAREHARKGITFVGFEGSGPVLFGLRGLQYVTYVQAADVLDAVSDMFRQERINLGAEHAVFEHQACRILVSLVGDDQKQC
jgi:hypothetical protein